MIRPIQPADREDFIRMVDEFYHSPAVLHPIPMAHIENTFEELMNQSPYAQAYLFECDGQTAGYALLALTHSNEAGGLTVWIEELLVLEPFRSRGLGRELFTFLKEAYPQAKRFRLEVTPENNDAIRLYKRMGYEPFDYLQMVLDTEEGQAQ